MRINKGVALSMGLLASVSLGIAQESDTSQYLTKFPIQDISQGRFLFYSSSEEWIPPALPANTACFGCCLIPLGGCLIGHEVFSKRPETTEVFKERKLSIGLSYSPGVAYTGDKLRKRLALETGEIDPFAWFYWNNILRIDIQYYFKTKWAIEIGAGYMWAKMENRDENVRILTSSGSPWGGFGNWNISSKLLSFHIYWMNTNGNDLYLIGAGSEYYFTKGVDIEVKERWSPSGTETKSIILTNWGKGVGLSVSLNLLKKFASNFYLNFASEIRYGYAEEYRYSISKSAEQISRLGSIDLYFHGIYFKIGLVYNVLNKKKGGVYEK